MNRLFATIASAILLVLSANAQPSAVKNITKSMFTLKAFDKNGNTIATSNGIFTSGNGEGVCTWTPIANAARAEITDCNGRKYEVSTIIGANELYDVCKIKAATQGKTTPATLASSAQPAGAKVWLLTSTDKKATGKQYEVQRTEAFMDKYSYYILNYNDEIPETGSPFVNDKGEVIGLLQASETSNEIHAVDAQYITSLKLETMALNTPMITKTGIRMELPDDKDQALLLLMMSSEQRDSTKYANYMNDFIQKFPHDVDGYSTRALNKVANNDFAGADADMKTALKEVTNKAEAHAEYARVMYHKLVYNADTTFTEWNFDKALQEAETAYKLDAQPSYKHRMAQINFMKGEYATAYDMFNELTTTSLRSGEVYYEAAQCKAHLQAPQEEIIVLLDSAVAACPKPLSNVSAPYVLARATAYDAIKEYRKALADYNTYDTLMFGRASAEFYYTRYRCELNIRQYQQALNDIAHAAYINPQEPIYYAEMASLELRVNRLDEAVKAADLCLRVAPDNTDALIIKGVALSMNGKKAEGLESLKKADELGDERAKEMMEKYK
jgi:tetratricopeptide (TPR) repeat protein